MSSYKIKEGVYSVGALNPGMRTFDIVMTTEYGTSYNSYIVKGSEKTALIECCHLRFFDRFLENIREVTDPEKIDYIILNHNEPDHSGCLAKLHEVAPNAVIIASRAGSIYLKNITNIAELNIRIAAEAEEIDLGGKTLRFVMAPFLHWPDSMFTYLPEQKVLFSCDFLGAHYCEPYVMDTNIAYVDSYKNALAVYFDAIFGPFKPYVRAGLEKMSQLSVDTCCCSHGPVLTEGCMLEYAVERYTKWSAERSKAGTVIPVFYTSAYGNTRVIAEALREGMLSVKPEAQVELFDIIENNLCDLACRLNESDAFAIGSPTINGEATPPIWQLLAFADALNNKKKPVFVFGSYGWSGEAVPNITARLNGLKMKPFGEGLKVCFVPNEADIEKAKSAGAEFAASF